MDTGTPGASEGVCSLAQQSWQHAEDLDREAEIDTWMIKESQGQKLRGEVSTIIALFGLNSPWGRDVPATLYSASTRGRCFR